MEIDFPTPNRALAEVLLSQRIREICYERADMAMMLYQAEVSKRSGALARAAHPHTEIGGRRHDRWIGVLSVAASTVDYEAAHEFGYTHELGEGEHGPGEFIPGHHDLNRVLEQLGSM